MPAKPGNHTIALAFVLDFEHRALVRFINSPDRLGDNSIQTGALKSTKPIRRHARVAGCWRQVNGRFSSRKQAFQDRSALFKSSAAQIPVSFTENIEKDNRCRSFFCKQLDS